MNSRIEKYHSEEDIQEIPSRVAKNQDLYNDISMPEFTKTRPNDNIKVLETTNNKIDIEKIKKYIESNNEDNIETKKSIVVKDDIDNLPQNDLFNDEKIYDINSILEIAKEKKDSYYEDEKHKKLRDTQYDILSKIKIYDETANEEDITEDIKLNTEEKTLAELINTVVHKKDDMFSELTEGSENTLVTSPIKEEINDEYINNVIKSDTDINIEKEEDNVLEKTDSSIKNLDKSFYTNSMTFSKEDFEGFEELEKTVKKNNAFVKVGIFILVILALATIFVILKYVLNVF